MKHLLSHKAGKPLLASMLLAFHHLTSFAQDSTNVNINTEQVESWFAQNWMWVAIGAVVLIVIIAMASGGSKKSTVKKTTIVKEEDPSGIVKTTTTEVRE